MRAVRFTGDTQTITCQKYCGFSLRETTGSAPATVRIYNQTPGGTEYEAINLLANESRSEFYGVNPIGVETGVLYIAATGAVAGSIRVGQ